MLDIRTWLSNTPPEIGYVLLVLGFFLFWKSWSLKQNRNNHITASGSAVVITGSNSGPISTGASSNNSPTEDTASTPLFERFLSITGSLASLIGSVISILPFLK